MLGYLIGIYIYERMLWWKNKSIWSRSQRSCWSWYCLPSSDLLSILQWVEASYSGCHCFWCFSFRSFYGQCHFCINGVKIRTSTDVSFSVLIFILLSDSFQIFFDIFLISIFRWFIKRCSKKLIWKILLFYIMIWIIMRIFISDSMS